MSKDYNPGALTAWKEKYTFESERIIYVHAIENTFQEAHMRESTQCQILKMFLVLFLGPLLLVFGGCAARDIRGSMDKQMDVPISESITLAPFRSHEKCMKLVQGQKLEFSFQASLPVNFNIHYHGKIKVLYPIKKDKILSDSGLVTVEALEPYCMSWENLKFEENKLALEYTIHSK